MELADNFVQFSVTLLGFCLSGMRYLKGRKQAYFLLTCFYGCFALGSLYWTLYLFLFSKNAAGFLCIGVWLGGKRYFSFYFAILPFLCGGKRLCVPKGADCLSDRRSLMYIYCTFGDVLSNLLWCGMMIAVSYHAIRGLTYARTQTGAARQLRYFHIGVLCYVAAEYILWTSGCFRQGDSAFFLYYGFDVLLTGCIFALLPATGRAVQA